MDKEKTATVKTIQRSKSEGHRKAANESTPNAPMAPQIAAFYPGYGYPPPPTSPPYAQGVGLVPLPPQGLYSQASGGPYGMLYPTPSYDVSIALAAMAVGEARALLHSTQELRDTLTSQTPQPTSDEIKDDEMPSPESTLRRRSTLRKTRSDVASWRKDATPIARAVSLPPTDLSIGFLDRFKKTRGHGYTLQDISGHVALMSLDQTGSRWLQQQLDQTRLSGAQMIIKEVLQNALLLSRDVFGNYVVQKTIEHVDQENKDAIARTIKGRTRRLTFDVYGCRVVQRLIERADISMAVELAKELEEVMLNCVLDTNASHVVQKCIECLPSEHITFLLDPLFGHLREVGSSSAGCRVVQRLIEHCSVKELRDRALSEIIDAVTELSSSEYGNYVIQHVAQYGGSVYRNKAMHRIGTNFRLLSHHRYASRVVERFLSHADEDELRYMIGNMFAIDDDRFVEETWVLDMMRDPFANYIVQKILEVSPEDVQSMFADLIKKNGPALSGGYAKRVVDAAINMGLLTATDVLLRQTSMETEEDN